MCFESQRDPKRAAPNSVRLLTAEDAPAFAAFCERDPLRSLTSRMNIEAYGFDGPILRSWGAFRDERAELIGILTRFSNIAIAVDRDGGCAPAFAALIDTLPGVAGIRGPEETCRSIQTSLSRYTPTHWENSYFLRLLGPPVCDPKRSAPARRASLQDLDRLTELYAGAGAMYRSRANIAAKLKESRVFVVEASQQGRRSTPIVACALLNVEGKDAGLIGGVYTMPEARGNGYAAVCTAALSLDLQQDRKTACLFYENPIAGRVYQRLGYEECGQWAVLYLAAVGAP